MPTTLEFSAETPRYSVKQAAELTGLSLNQVRLWERRYQLIDPQRAENGYRLYSQDDLDILKYALRETQRGVTIQVVSEQVRAHRAQIIEKARQKKKSQPVKVNPDDAFLVPNLEQLIQAVQDADAVKFERMLVQAQAGQSFANALRTVDLPVLARIGELTILGAVNIAASHLASAIIRRRILSHLQNLGVYEHAQPVLLACVPNEYHEIGLLCAMMELTQRMIPTLYFGANLPHSELELYAQKSKPSAIVLSVVAPLRDREAQHLVERLQAGLVKHFPVAVGGYEAEKRRHLFEASGIKVFKNIEELLKWRVIRQLGKA
ncbi:hypothetical protein COW36_05655 [bacterium (Candidatus Blackallbacteria) CG17_big_fil_post_rev_8_21_14_2_50_48_46]|uniref:HTH merR-type domain-containing protein n=1 Tax=bacterium (Candidatus Blackallbacteria) CG17_big_fil_post_rev_8_21_14_2_50_48_46 TaxID=2014261 RepID=A0A2M7G841_9BACT|nr:MAG: hypothetical protein COW64_21250 [bacterium (Candidatus Blackallbacteria) CG18_big_fil_WC_8_21_14_2_50_49_26]PIW18253.1 MAG: hypothetical protein COW36_05655 [bacterium (Candidatus Blackallbacteria) CG17_big_fil_post_rev_8_21_14_2_50_48_46]PIW50684.1 MAG: hypothetical protein COW20_01920 [bacterium (Candidatus Blackallbacteria) CG13_big_fil_rev_8_21_14_2_50_49_14]